LHFGRDNHQRKDDECASVHGSLFLSGGPLFAQPQEQVRRARMPSARQNLTPKPLRGEIVFPRKVLGIDRCGPDVERLDVGVRF
jgi:hypothetical protein